MEGGDDETIDRLLAARPLAGREITLITFDTHMSTKARISGVPVIKLDQPEPPDKKRPGGSRTRSLSPDRSADVFTGALNSA